jgi:hypothetical protein
VPEQRDLGVTRRERELQQLVVTDGRPEMAHVVTELADLGRGLVDEREHAVRRAHGAVHEEWIRGAALDESGDGRIREVQPVPTHQQVDASRVAAADLQAIEG